MKAGPLDTRGYQGGERNRQLDPKEVVWARTAYQAREVSARQLAQQFGMSLDGVRRMLRGDTYANVGEALPRSREVAEAASVDDGGVLERLLTNPPEVMAKGETSGDEVVNLFLEEDGKDAG